MLRSAVLKKGLIILFSMAVVYSLLRVFIFSQDPVLPAIQAGISLYLSVAENLSNIFLSLTGFAVRVTDHTVTGTMGNIMSIDSGVLLKKWFVFLLIIIWITPVVWTKRVAWSLFLILLDVLMASVNITLLATGSNPDLMSAIQIARTPGVLAMTTFLVLWVVGHQEKIAGQLHKWGIPNDFMYKNLNSIIVVLFIYIIMGNPVLGYFDFKPWVHFLLSSSHHLLAFFGIDSVVSGKLIVGNNANLYLGKACLGMKTILLFAGVVYLTGNKGLLRWLYILGGIIFINLVNIIRLTLLFAYVQRHNGYDLTMDVHDMYDYVIYALIFILWIVWFEFFTGIRKKPGFPSFHSDTQ